MSQQVFHSPWINQQSPCKPKIVKKDYISFICPQKFPLYTKKMRQCSFWGEEVSTLGLNQIK